jgi:ATP-dependent Clp protease protease subunit
MVKRKYTYTETDQWWVEHGIDIPNRRAMLNEGVTDKAVGGLLRAVQIMDEMDEITPIKVYINTDGGSFYDGLALYDILKNCKAPVHTYGLGKVISMGTVIMLAGDERYCFSNTTYMWHSITDATETSKVFDHVTNVQEILRMQEQMLRIYAEHSTKSVTWWRKWIKHEDRYGNADKALELGFVNQIL